jgi:integrase
MNQPCKAEGPHQVGSLLPVNSTLSDVITQIKSHPGIAPARQREMVSAIRTVCRILSLPPESVPAAPAELRERLKRVSHLSAGLSVGRWNNVRSLTLTALNIAGILTLPGRSREPLSSDWEALLKGLCRRDLRYGLSRFVSFCSARKIAPAAVDARAFELYSEVLANGSLVRFPKTNYRTTCLMWNQAAETTAGWPKFRVTVPSHRRRYTLSYDNLPPTFRSDVEAYLNHVENRDPFSDDYAPALRAATIHGRRKEILQLVTAALSGAGSAEEMVSLAVLTHPENAKRALRFFYDRAGGEKSEGLHNKAILLRTIARNWCKATKADFDALDGLCKRLAFKRTGMTEKNKALLRQFDDPKNLASLLTLPERVLRRTRRGARGFRGEAVEVMCAAAIELLLTAPMRIKNLTSLETERHLIRTGHTSDSVVHIVIPAHEMKNNEQYEMELPAESWKLLTVYLQDYRPGLASAPSPWVFPSYGGRRRGTVPFSAKISKFILRETGIRMHVHLFRHLAVKLHLKAHPDDLETARRILGHKSLKTTLKSYADIRTAAAFQKYDQLIAKLRQEARQPLKAALPSLRGVA